jgi:hypothetical protein
VVLLMTIHFDRLLSPHFLQALRILMHNIAFQRHKIPTAPWYSDIATVYF